MSIAKGSRQPHTSLPKRILGVLRESPLPVSTPSLRAICKQKHFGAVWAAMLRLEKAGVVVRVSRSPEGSQWMLKSKRDREDELLQLRAEVGRLKVEIERLKSG